VPSPAAPAVAEDDRAARPAWRQLDHLHLVGLRVVVEIEADLVAVELDRSVDVADGQHDDFEGPIHGRFSIAGWG
jgi:hypothetical protein